jgi:riboflavin kinase/FMN adenylyltransferase
MEIIRHILSHPRLPHPVVSLGNFDGVHLGHQTILRRLVQEAERRQGTALVVTFHPHPLSVLRPDRPLSLILSLREKLDQLAQQGVQRVVLQRFSRAFSRLSPEEFVHQYLVQAIGVEKIIIGHNFSFGRDRSGSAGALAQLGQRYGFEVEVVGPVRTLDREVSSSAIRSLLSAGDLDSATALLSRPYTVSGRVQKGFQRGRTIGFPTANLRPQADLLLPNGVYAVRVDVGQQTRLAGVANVGVNPTFGQNTRTIEAHIFDFSADIYGQRLRVGFVARLREERTFPSAQDLVDQIQEDAERARALLSQ